MPEPARITSDRSILPPGSNPGQRHARNSPLAGGLVDRSREPTSGVKAAPRKEVTDGLTRASARENTSLETQEAPVTQPPVEAGASQDPLDFVPTGPEVPVTCPQCGTECQLGELMDRRCPRCGREAVAKVFVEEYDLEEDRRAE